MTAPPAHAALRHLSLTVTRRLDGLLHGQHLGLRAGPGSEPGDARLYQPGEDDVRTMDWAVTARTTHPHVRDPIADRELATWTLLDLSPTMDFGTAHAQKRDVAISTLAAVAHLTHHIGDRNGTHVLRNGHLTRSPAATNHNAHLAHARALTAPLPPDPGHTTLATALTDLARTRPRRGLRVIISDFLDTPTTPHTQPSWQTPLHHLSARHQTLAIEILDPRELDLPAIGLVTMSDPTTGRTRHVHLTPDLQHRYAHAARQQRTAIRDAIRTAGATHLTLRTDRDWILDIARHATLHRTSPHRR
ncbi:DUF58 domain-containing protein [Nocardiopsis ansamitocini]|uniref:DUF58 domain-containing protein n=1 Tax=Nocardiopsis ansamitocini TaxID=1670832 RepID=A0A9W6UH49_9ACTN|nr:DUF58 domain-containing protein [Nocardiopsis ansamitocini]GLU48466.1 hypothetical protein Nans01_28170 [Nocardiopsis ansamitocini]